MAKQLAVLIMGVVLLAAFFACSDETTEPTGGETSNTAGVVRGEIDPGEGGFELVVRSNSADPMVGPFVLRGSNINYVDTINALSVDLTIENDGQVSHPLPIGLTFVSLMPGGVTVENPDNDEKGPGAGILFDFENRDNEWAPGEKSLPRTTLLRVDQGMAVGFVAYVDIPQDTTTGTIGGIVWNDLNEDGVIDNDEPGVEGAVVYLYEGNEPGDTLMLAPGDHHRMETQTAGDGSYRFVDLEAGFYTVIRDFMDEDCFPTTPTVIHVVLVEENGTVSDFLTANFGCVEDGAPQMPVLGVGDYVKVNGQFADDGQADLVARSIEVIECDSPPDPDSIMVDAAWSDGWKSDWDGNGDDDWDDDDWDDCHERACWDLKNAIRGPVTDIDRDNCRVEIMGTWVNVMACAADTLAQLQASHDGDGDGDGDRKHYWLDLDDIEVGDRVWARVLRKEEDDMFYAWWLKGWNGTPDKVFGRVESMSPPDGPAETIEVLGVTVTITERTDIYFCD